MAKEVEKSFVHRPVLLQEVIEGLNIKEDGIYIDATFGRGGHAREILRRLGPKGQLFAIDKDPQAAKAAQEDEFKDKRFSLKQGSFTMLLPWLQQLQLIGKVDGILLDLGVSSPQLDDPERGFSFLKEGPLDMRMDPKQKKNAADWVNSAPEREIAQILKEYGEERFARRIAAAIVREREVTPITNTKQLAEIVSKANPKWERHKHPATRAFQAIRIFINDELEELKQALSASVEVLAEKGRLVVISFHSLEDRIVKRFIEREAKGDEFPERLPLTFDQIHPRLRRLGRAIRPSEAEITQNARARSAVLRIAEKIGQ